MQNTLVSNPSTLKTRGLFQNPGAFPNPKGIGQGWVGTFINAWKTNIFIYFNFQGRHFQVTK